MQETFVFRKLPENEEDFKALPEYACTTPFQTAALTILALTVYPADHTLSYSLLNLLRGPRPLSIMDKQFISDRFMEHPEVIRSYYKGAVTANDYTITMPYTLTVYDNPHSYNTAGTEALIWINSGGADSPRSIKLRQAKDNRWYLWEQMVLSQVRTPASEDPWK